MAWRQTGDKPLSEPIMTQFDDAYMCEVSYYLREYLYVRIVYDYITRGSSHIVYQTGFSVIIYRVRMPRFKYRTQESYINR